VFSGKARLQDELNAAKPYWREVCKVTKKEVHFILGNHENRLYRFIGANLWAYQLEAFEWQNMAALPPMVKVHEYGAQKKIGPITFEHGDRIGGRFGCTHPTHWLLQNRGNRNTVFGHTHRLESKTRTVFDEYGEPHVYIAHNQGHGSDVKQQKYAGPEPNWQHGFTYIEFYTEGGKPRFSLHPIIIVNGRFSWGGRVYDGQKL
jgi:hypothetical protein